MASLSMATAADQEAGLRGARSMLDVFVDDSCGTAPSRRFPLPPPWPRSGVKPNVIDALVAAAQFHAVSKVMTGQALADTLAAAADRLLESGLRRFAG